jgi:cell division septal protein FtsQ
MWARRRRVFTNLVIGSLALGLLLGLLDSEAFRLRTIYLEGPRRDLLVKVKPLLSDLGYTSTVLCRGDALADLAKQCSLVADVKVRKELPHTIEMHIEPRKPAAAVSTARNPEAYVLADRRGLPYEAVTGAATGNVPRLRAFPTKSLLVGHAMPAKAQATYAEIVGGIEDSGAKWRAVDMAKPASLVGYLIDATKVKIGGLDNVRRKLALAGWVWREAKAKGMEIEYIDVRLPRRPTFMPKGGGETEAEGEVAADAEKAKAKEGKAKAQ